MNHLNRRRFLGAGAMAVAGVSWPWSSGRGQSAMPGEGPRFLIVLTASGGASIIDGPLAIRASESSNASTVNTFPDALVTTFDGSPFRAVDLAGDSVGAIPIGFSARQSDFVRRRHHQMVVATQTGTSVNHQIGQRRSVTGNEAWAGRTLQEVVASAHGEGFALPNVHLATGTAFTEAGTDARLTPSAFGEPVADPALWPLALDARAGLDAPAAEWVDAARTLRNEHLDPKSRFQRVFGRSPRLQEWVRQRGAPQQTIEQADLVSKLMLFPDSERHPLEQYGLRPSPSAVRVREVFPNFDRDPLEAQAALAFLLLKFRVSVTVTLGPGFNVVLDRDGSVEGLPDGSLLNPPIAFDFSHQAHRNAQAFMWDRIYRVADGLMTLLEEEEYADGQSMWDRSLLYVATEFGRTKTRPADSTDFGSGHDLNNGLLVISPMIRGNRVLGGVDPNTGLTFGYAPLTGAPDPGRVMAENVLYAGLLHALRVETSGSGLPSAPALRG